MNNVQQESIPVGCIPTAEVGYLGVYPSPSTGTLPPPPPPERFRYQRYPDHPPPPREQTHASENITFPQLSSRSAITIHILLILNPVL